MPVADPFDQVGPVRSPDKTGWRPQVGILTIRGMGGASSVERLRSTMPAS